MKRKLIIVGNWKMNGSITDLKRFIKDLKPSVSDKVDAGLCVPYTMLATLKEEAKDLNFKIGAQNMHYNESGAFTGEISPDMLLEIGVDTVIIGHSERRSYYNETDETVNLKLLKAIEKKLKPIVCVGESLVQREKGLAKDICKKQVENAFKGVSKTDAQNVILAYEPIWAIGTGKTASSEDAEEMALYIRNVLKDIFDEHTADIIRIQYGGSVKPSNVEELMAMPNIDGALVGGASLKTEDFAKLIDLNI